MNSKHSTMIRLNLESFAIDMKSIPKLAAKERTAMTAWARQVNGTRAPVHYNLDDTELGALDDVIVSIDADALVIVANIDLNYTELGGLVAIVRELAKARGCAGARLVIERLMVRGPSTDGIARLARMRIVQTSATAV